MALWWEGMGKHLVNWCLALITHNRSAKPPVVDGTIAELDHILINFNCKHTDRDMPTNHFYSGISSAKARPAKHLALLIIQLQVAFGTSNRFFTTEQQPKVQDFLAMLIQLGWQLHMRGYSETRLRHLDMLIYRYSGL